MSREFKKVVGQRNSVDELAADIYARRIAAGHGNQWTPQTIAQQSREAAEVFYAEQLPNEEVHK